jgi:ABC-type branched-subunit amino acid transport system substrate-binding protein
MFADAGQTLFDHKYYEYFHRLVPSDAAQGVAFALWAHKRRHDRAAMVFPTSGSGDTSRRAITTVFPRLGAKIVANVKLTPDQPSYQSQAAKVVAANPQVIFYQGDPSTTATFFSEYKQLGGTAPVIGNETMTEPDNLKAIQSVFGTDVAKKKFTAIELRTASNGPAVKLFQKALTASADKVPHYKQYLDNPFSISAYDGANLLALAMVASKSTTPSSFNPTIINVTKPSAGSVVVHGFEAGKKALQSGKKIQYVGAGGPIHFNKHHGSSGSYNAVSLSSHPNKIGSVAGSTIAKLLR